MANSRRFGLCKSCSWPDSWWITCSAKRRVYRMSLFPCYWSCATGVQVSRRSVDKTPLKLRELHQHLSESSLNKRLPLCVNVNIQHFIHKTVKIFYDISVHSASDSHTHSHCSVSAIKHFSKQTLSLRAITITAAGTNSWVTWKVSW